MVDQLFQVVRELDPSLELKYDKFYVGLAQDGQPHNFVIFRPRRNTLMLTGRLQQSAETQTLLEESDLEVLDFSKREVGYRVRLGLDDVNKRRDVLKELIEMAYRTHVG